jgi:hypothetical protein
MTGQPRLGFSDYMIVALWVASLLAILWLGFSYTLFAHEAPPPVNSPPCVPGFVIGYGTLTADSTGDGWAVGQGLWILPKPETVAEYRLRALDGRGVEVVIRVADAR